MTRELAVQEVMTLGQVFVKSGYFPDAKAEAQAVVKIMAGQELGVGPFASMQGIIVNRGQLSLSAGLVGSLIKRHPLYDYRVVTHSSTVCTLHFYQSGEKVGESTFTIEDANTAGLTSGGNAHSWKHYPRNMLFSRALTNGARWYCPDVFGGAVYTPDELGDVVDGEVIEVEPPAEIPTDAPLPELEPPSEPVVQTNGKWRTNWHAFTGKAMTELGYQHVHHVTNTLRKEHADPEGVWWNSDGTFKDGIDVDALWAVLEKHKEDKA